MIIPSFLIALVLLLLLLIKVLLLYLVMRIFEWAWIDLNPELLPVIWTLCSDHIYTLPSIIVTIRIIMTIHIVTYHHHHFIMHCITHHYWSSWSSPHALYHTNPKLNPINWPHVNACENADDGDYQPYYYHQHFHSHCHDQYSMNWWLALTPANWPSRTSALMYNHSTHPPNPRIGRFA